MSIKTVSMNAASAGPLDQHYLVEGDTMALRAWNRAEAGEAGSMHRRDYETVGYVVEGRVELELDGETTVLQAGDSWCVPKGAERRYRVLETLTAIEATYPKARNEDDGPVG